MTSRVLASAFIAATFALLGCGSDEATSGTANGGGGASATSSAQSGSGPTTGSASTGTGGTGPSAFPDASNTGYAHAPDYPGSLTPWGGGPLEDGHTYSFIDFP